MSFLRIHSPYHEPRDVPLGPSSGRITSSRLGIRGGGPPVVVGALAVGITPRNGAHQAAYRAREAEKARERRAAR